MNAVPCGWNYMGAEVHNYFSQTNDRFDTGSTELPALESVHFDVAAQL